MNIYDFVYFLGLMQVFGFIIGFTFVVFFHWVKWNK